MKRRRISAGLLRGSRQDYAEEKIQFNDCFKEIPALTTEQFYLTAFCREDMEEYFDILRDERVQRYLGGGVPLFDREPHITN